MALRFLVPFRSNSVHLLVRDERRIGTERNEVSGLLQMRRPPRIIARWGLIESAEQRAQDDLELACAVTRIHLRKSPLATSATGVSNGGLAPLGRDAVALMIELGMIVDLAHAAPRWPRTFSPAPRARRSSHTPRSRHEQ